MPTQRSAIAMTGLAIEAREAIYGFRPPFTRALRWEWVQVCHAMTRSAALGPLDVVRIARALGDDLRRNGAPLEATPEVDAGIRVELAARLRAEAKRLNRPRLTSAQRREGRIKTLAKG